MFCSNCGADVGTTVGMCPKCGAPLPSGAPPSVPPPPTDEFDQLVRDATRAAKNLTVAAARLTRKAAHKAGEAAKDPSTAAKKAGRKAVDALDDARRELEEALRHL